MNKARKIASESAIYIQEGAEAMAINCTDEDNFYCTGEESGEDYVIPYSDVNLDTDIFYKLVLVDNHQ